MYRDLEKVREQFHNLFIGLPAFGSRSDRDFQGSSVNTAHFGNGRTGGGEDLDFNGCAERAKIHRIYQNPPLLVRFLNRPLVIFCVIELERVPFSNCFRRDSKSLISAVALW